MFFGFVPLNCDGHDKKGRNHRQDSETNQVNDIDEDRHGQDSRGDPSGLREIEIIAHIEASRIFRMT